MAFLLKECIDFGKVNNFFSGEYDDGLFTFSLPKEKAVPIINKLNSYAAILDKAAKEINPEAWDVEPGCFELPEEGDDEIQFYVYPNSRIPGENLLGFNEERFTEMEGAQVFHRLKRIEDTDQVWVKCRLVVEEEDDINFVQLEAIHLTVKDKEGKYKPYTKEQQEEDQKKDAEDAKYMEKLMQEINAMEGEK